MSETVQLIPHQDSPRCIRLNEADNVAVVVNDGGVPVGAQFEGGLVTVEAVPQSHKVALVDIGEGEPVRRYGQIIGYALEPLRRGSWVKESQLRMPSAPPLDSLPRATAVPAGLDPLEGYTFEGYRNADGTVGTRNILGISTTVQCVTGKRPDGELAELIRKNVDLTPVGIIEKLKLRRPIYLQTASYGHFGRNESGFSWEETDLSGLFA